MSTVSTEKMMAQIACKAIDDKKGQDIKIIDIHNVSVIADYFVIASGTNSNQVQAIVDNVEEQLGRAGFEAKQIEGNRNSSSQQTGFTKVGEGGKIGAKNTPQFERIDYEISKYAGYFPVTNELLADSDANIASTLIEWIGDEARVTENNLIMGQINIIQSV